MDEQMRIASGGASSTSAMGAGVTEAQFEAKKTDTKYVNQTRIYSSIDEPDYLPNTKRVPSSMDSP